MEKINFWEAVNEVCIQCLYHNQCEGCAVRKTCDRRLEQTEDNFVGSVEAID